MTTTGNKPGVTKGKQWVRLTDDIELLDTPGLLWHKFEDEEVGNKLAMTGAISDEVFVWEDVAFRFLQIAQARYAALITERYSLDAEEVAAMDTYELMQTIGRKRGAMCAAARWTISRPPTSSSKIFATTKLVASHWNRRDVHAA